MDKRIKRFEKTELINKIKKISGEFKEYTDLINNINVFPITDKDTGTNVYITLKNFSKTDKFKGIGNSGIIFEIFGNEFLDDLPEYYTKEDLTVALKKGIEKLERSILELKEGTMYSLLKGLKEDIVNEKRINEIVLNAYERVKSTKEQIKEYTSQEVVDAGALSILILLWLLNNKRPNINIEEFQEEIKIQEKETYCINIICDSVNHEKIKTLESVIINRIKNKYKIHFHSRDLKSALEFENPKILKIIPESTRKEKEELCYISKNNKEKEYFNKIGLNVISSLNELISLTDPIRTLYIIKDKYKNILNKMSLDFIQILDLKEILIINEIISEKNRIDKKEILECFNDYSFVRDQPNNKDLVYKIRSKKSEDSIYFPFINSDKLFLIKKNN